MTTADALRAWVGEAVAAGRVAMDTETDGLDAMRARLVGFSLATATGRACYVPVGHEVLGEQIKLDDAIAVLGPLLKTAERALGRQMIGSTQVPMGDIEVDEG